MSARFLLIPFSLLVCLRQPSALALGDSVDVTATVLPTRTIYVDGSGQITKIDSNTSQNVTPIVISAATNRQLPLTSALVDQYHQFETRHARSGSDIAHSRASSIVGWLEKRLQVSLLKLY